jgi:tetratricopeptide (TPR) repeat protein
MMQGLDDTDMAALLPPLDGYPGPARRLSSARTARMVSEIVDAASAQPHEPAAVPVPLSPFDITRSVIFEPPAEPRPRGVARRGLAMAAALVVASVGSAAAGVWIAMRERPQAAEPPRAASAPAAEREPVRRARVQTPAAVGSAPAEAPEPAGVADEAPAGDPIEAPEQIDDSGDAADPAEDAGDLGDDAADATDAARPRRSERARRRALRQRRERAAREAARSREAATRDVEPPEPAMPSHTEPASREPVVMLPADAPVEDIVALANQQRKEKRWRAAEALYERVMRDHARTDAAAIATVASASLHLDHLADPAGALRRFRQALRLRPDGPLAEEARWGLAETYRALGDVEEERTALDRFLSAHPRSVNAARARQRLTELGAGR